MQISATFFKDTFDTNVSDYMEPEWEDLVPVLMEYTVTNDKKNNKLISFAKYKESRNDTNVDSISAIAFDFDAGVSILKIQEKLIDLNFEFVIHTTHSHTQSHNKFRAVIPFKRSVTPKEYQDIWQLLSKQLGNVNDKQAKNVSRMYYLPSCTQMTKDQTYTYHNKGLLANPDKILRNKTIPQSSNVSVKEQQQSVDMIEALLTNIMVKGEPFFTPYKDGDGRDAATIARISYLHNTEWKKDLAIQAMKLWNNQNIDKKAEKRILEIISDFYKTPPITKIQTNIVSSSSTIYDRETLSKLLTDPLYFAENLLEIKPEIKQLLFPKSQADIKYSRYLWEQALTDITVMAANQGYKALNGTKITSKQIENVLGYLKTDIEKEFINDFNNKYKYDPTIDPEHLHCKLALDYLRAHNPTYFPVLHDWLVNVKRNLLGLRIDHHIVPFFFSNRGGDGKSRMICNIFKPLEDYLNSAFVLSNISANAISDNFFSTSIAGKYIGFFDEVNNLDSKAIIEFKRIITAPQLSGRGMYNETMVNTPNKCSYICASNQPIDKFLQDTSQRRYYEIECSMDDEIYYNIEKQDQYWKEFNENFDAEILWKSIDPYTKKCTGDIWTQMKQKQDENKLLPYTHQFFEYWREKMTSGRYGDTIKASECYEAYKEWMIANAPGKSPVSSQVFGKDANRVPFIKLKRDMTNRYYIFTPIKE